MKTGFFAYMEYEMNLERLRRMRVKNLLGLRRDFEGYTKEGLATLTLLGPLVLWGSDRCIKVMASTSSFFHRSRTSLFAGFVDKQ